MSIPRLSIGRPVAVAMLSIAVVFLGVLSLTRLPVDLLPDIAYPRLVIYSSYSNVGPAEVERFVTEPIEQAVSRVPGKERIESVTREGISLVTLQFAWGTDMDFAALNVREALDRIRGSLPETLDDDPVVLRTDPRSEPVMAISVAGETNVWSLKELAESVFRRRLEQIDGVAQAAVTGGLEREIHVDVDPVRMESYGLTIDQVASALSAANASSTSGTIRRGRFRYSLRTLGELQSVAEIEQIMIVQASQPDPNAPPDDPSQGVQNRRVMVRDIATVIDGFRERETIARYNGKEAIGLLVFKESGANTVQVDRDVRTVLEQLRGEYPEVAVDVAMSQAGFVASAIANLIQEMVLGAILAFFVLMLFLRDARYPVAIALAIPISVISTFALLHAFGVTLNIMSLGGLALGIGMLVDNSIVVIENIFRHTEKGLRTAAAAAIGTEEVQRAITASTLTTIAVFGPVIYVEGVAGELFAALSLAVAFSLLASLFVAVTLLPTMAARWDADDGRRGVLYRAIDVVGRSAPFRAFDRAWDRVARKYEDSLDWALQHRTRVVSAAALMLAITVPFALDLERSVLPQVDQGEFRARIDLARGSTIETTAETAATLEAILLADEAVDAVFSRIGKQVAVGGLEEDRSGLHTAVLDVRLKEGETTDAVLARIRPQLATLPSGAVTVETGAATALGTLLGGGVADLALRVQGEDLDAALTYASEIRGRIAAVPNLTNVRIGTELGQPEYVIEIDRDRAAGYGIEPRRVATVIDNYMRGNLATEYVDFDRKIDVYVRLPEEDRRSLETLQMLRVDDVPLGEIVSVRASIGPVEIERLDQNRFVPVYADVTGGGIDEAVSAIQSVVAASPPPGQLRAEVGGENEEMRRSFRDLALAFGLAVLLVYMILAAEFESLIHPFTVLLSVPLGIIGAIIALWLFGAGLNTVSLIGIVILVGIVDNDAVVKIDFINQMRREGMNVRDAIRAAGHARLRPIVMNTITTMLAITPMMLGLGVSSGLQAPLAIAIFGGLFTSTILTLIVIPVVYELIEDLRVWLASRGARATGRTMEPHPAGSPATGD
jgi:hydrophobic/amphiphilic exporter-1 (mainly G- bacteria), HAE1 family